MQRTSSREAAKAAHFSSGEMSTRVPAERLVETLASRVSPARTIAASIGSFGGLVKRVEAQPRDDRIPERQLVGTLVGACPARVAKMHRW